jgi:hypothetical protein
MISASLSFPEQQADLQNIAPRDVQIAVGPVREIAAQLGVSERQVAYLRKLFRSGRDDLVGAVEPGEMSVHAAVKSLDPVQPRSGLQRLQTGWSIASEVDRVAFRRWLDGQDGDDSADDDLPGFDADGAIDDDGAFGERAGILEFDGGYPREVAERLAAIELGLTR